MVILKTFILSLWILAHPASTSFLGVECFPEKGIIKVNLNLNYNDFIFDYRLIINDDQSFDLSGKIDTAEILVSKYLDARIQIFADDKMLKGYVTGIESSDGKLKLDQVYNYNKRSKCFKVRNLILTDVNKSQSNLLIFKYNDLEEDVKLTSEKTEHSFNVK